MYLKDASSTAIYGAQAANGVILITSPKGKIGLKPRISFSSSYTAQQPTVGDLKPYDRDGFIKFMTDNFYEKAYLAPEYTTPNPSFNLASVIDPVLIVAGSNPAQLNLIIMIGLEKPVAQVQFLKPTGADEVDETVLIISYPAQWLIKKDISSMINSKEKPCVPILR